MQLILTLQWHSNIRTSKEFINCSVNLRPQSLSLFAVQHHYILFLPKTVFYIWFCHLCSVEYLNLHICSNQFSIMIYWWEWEVTPSLIFFFWLGHLEKPSLLLCPLPDSVSAVLGPSSPQLYKTTLYLYALPRSPVSTSTVCAFVSCLLVWPACPYSAMLISCLNSCCWESLALVFNRRLP